MILGLDWCEDQLWLRVTEWVIQIVLRLTVCRRSINCLIGKFATETEKYTTYLHFIFEPFFSGLLWIVFEVDLFETAHQYGFNKVSAAG
jgi:hypothetical protein